ncbi:MAG: cell envelope integrity protein TolA [Chlorobiaceae bacterium]|jgi:colicin import membrane protein|nr:cell envelope integrity protein TolA [Chlorobiaceae bacterium]
MKNSRKLIQTTDKKFLFWLGAAAAMHAAVLAISLFLWMLDANRHIRTRVIDVTFVSLPGSEGARQSSDNNASIEAAAEQSPEKPLAQKKEKSVPEESQVPPKKIPEEPVKPKVNENPADISKTLERLKQNVDKKPQPQPASGSMNSALAALQQKVKSEGNSGTGTGSGGRGGVGSGYGSGGTADPYKAQIAMIIQKNWEFSKLMVRNSFGMEVYVRINILPDGTIREIIFDRRAQSEYLNNSVKKALEKSTPLPGLPKGQGNPDLWIGFVFTPEGIEK